MKSGHRGQDSVSAAFVIGILKAVQQLDSSLFTKLGAHLQENRLDTHSLIDPVQRIPHGKLLKLLDQINLLGLGRRDLFIEIGSRLTPASFSALGYAATSCRTLGKAIEVIPIYEKVAVTLGQTCLKKHEDHLELSWNCTSNSEHYRYYLEEIILAAWVQLAKNITNTQLQADKVLFTGPKPENVHFFKKLFGNHLAFNQAEATIIFSKKIENLAIVQFDPFINNLMKEQAAKLQQSLNYERSLSQAVSQSIYRGLIKGDFSQEHIAAEHNMSARTLRRSLTAQGTSYMQILAQVRRNKSKEYLQDNNLSIFEVAMLLGYSEHSTFSAAFKKWYEQSPLEFRERKV